MNAIAGLGKLSPETIQTIMTMFESLPSEKQALILELFLETKNETHKEVLSNGVEKLLNENPMFIQWIVRVIKQLSPNALRKFYNNLIINEVREGHDFRKKYLKEHGYETPVTIVINPTMRCNLKCTGCYAWKFSKREDMDYELLRKVLLDCRSIRCHFITVSGGEPFLYDKFFDIAEEFSDHIFMTYTNGTLLTEKMVEKIAKVGNIWPAISVEGFEKETDERRGKGVFKKILNAMKLLREYGVMFGFSATPTRYNTEVIASDEFVDFYIEQGALFGWMFTYIPIGRDPDITLMATPEQRELLRAKTNEWKRTKPIVIGDFWNDGPCVGGCISASRYLYITSDGKVQPCTFVHFYTHNIKDHSLKEIWESPFFRAIRERQPYHPNLLRPCKIIDNPEVLREIVEEVGAKPTYEGADDIIKKPEVVRHIDNYAKRWGELADKAWKSEEYSSGRRVLAPFLGIFNVYEAWPERMENAHKEYERRMKKAQKESPATIAK